MEEFLAAVAGAIVGGMISMFTTAFFNWQADLRLRKNRLLSLQFRVMESIEDIRKLNQHLTDSLTKDGKVVVEQKNFCQHVLEMRGFDPAPIAVRSAELAILYKKKHNDLVQSIMELIRARNIAASLFADYNTLKQSIDQEFVRLGEFTQDGDELKLRAVFDAREEKPLLGQIHKANMLLRQLWEFLTDVLDNKKSLLEEFNDAPRHYFPFWVKNRKVEILPIERRAKRV